MLCQALLWQSHRIAAGRVAGGHRAEVHLDLRLVLRAAWTCGPASGYFHMYGVFQTLQASLKSVESNCEKENFKSVGFYAVIQASVSVWIMFRGLCISIG